MHEQERSYDNFPCMSFRGHRFLFPFINILLRVTCLCFVLKCISHGSSLWLKDIVSVRDIDIVSEKYCLCEKYCLFGGYCVLQRGCLCD